MIFSFQVFFIPNPLVAVFLYNIVDLNLCSLVTQNVDIYFRFLQYKFTFPKRNSWDWMVIFGFSFVTMVLSWSPFYTVVPFFVDTNSPNMQALIYAGNMVYLSSSLAFNSFFTILFLRSLNISKNYENRRLRYLAAKSIAHGILRCQSPQSPLNMQHMWYEASRLHAYEYALMYTSMHWCICSCAFSSVCVCTVVYWNVVLFEVLFFPCVRPDDKQYVLFPATWPMYASTIRHR